MPGAAGGGGVMLHPTPAIVPTADPAAVAAAAAPSPARVRRRQVDGFLASATGALILLGLVVSFSASFPVALEFGASGTSYLLRHAAWVGVGLMAATVMVAVDYRVWRQWSVPLLVGTLIMLLVTLVFGVNRYGGERWLLAGGSVQPSELAKLLVIIYVADWLSSKRDDIRDVTLGLMPFAILIGTVCGLIVLQNHLSTAILIGAVATAMFFTAGAHLGQMVASGGMAGLVIVGLIVRSPYRFERIATYLDPYANPWHGGWQVIRSLESFERGGLFGVGLGQGQEKHVLPLPHTDAVFAVVGEELGLLGCLVVLVLFGVVAWRGFRVAAGVPNRFASLLATGLTCWIVGQALLNVAVATNFVPTTGVPLPFISYGGSSMVACMAGMGLLLNLSRWVEPTRVNLYGNLDLRRGDRRSRLSRTHRARRLGR